jgi:predicted RNA-binding Zn ribbon-like protein
MYLDGVVDTNDTHSVVDVPPGFQPAGRAPAPPPLDLVQDFVNTEIAVWEVDDIATPEALAEWLRARDLVRDGVVVDASAFVRARAIRRVLRELASRNTRGAVADDELRAEFLAITAETDVRFALGERGELRLGPADDGVNGALAVILARVYEAQASGTWRRLKSCPGPHCGWLFYDASRNASSTWCSMSICGNRTKTAAYRMRRKAAQ